MNQKNNQSAFVRTAIRVLILVCALDFSGWTAETGSVARSQAEALLGHVRYLASDELMGRGVDTPGMTLARDYIAAEFKKSGLLPGGDHGTYFQRFEVVTGLRAKEPTALALSDNPPLVVSQDWTPLGLSHAGSVEGEIVFVGYGITTRNYDYDDYAGVDVRDKIVLVLRYEPPRLNDNSPFERPPRYSRYATLNAKVSNARNHGAIGMILVDLNRVQGDRELISLRRNLGQNDSGLLVAQVKAERIEKWLNHSNISLAALKEKIDRQEKPASMPLPGLKVSLHVELERITHKTDNIIGILPGSDPQLKEQHIVIGAHYDHIGLGFFGTRDPSTEGQIHNGADDNASGTAVIMSVAQRLTQATQRPPRTIVFVAFSGEELGLKGSSFYVAHPTFPLEKTVAMINLDMVGRMRDNQVMAAGIDSAKEFSAWVAEAARQAGVEIRFSTKRGSNSDHASFLDKNIPALHLYTGTHEDYHRPTDHWEKLNIEGMSKVSDLVSSLAGKIAAGKEPVIFVRSPSPTAQTEATPASLPPAQDP